MGLLPSYREDPDASNKTMGNGGMRNVQQLREMNKGIWTPWELKWEEGVFEGTQNAYFQIGFEWGPPT